MICILIKVIDIGTLPLLSFGKFWDSRYILKQYQDEYEALKVKKKLVYKEFKVY